MSSKIKNFYQLAALSLANIPTDDMFYKSPIKVRDPLQGLDIGKEYRLIKQKNSGLSRQTRDLVVRRYEIEYNEKDLQK